MREKRVHLDDPPGVRVDNQDSVPGRFKKTPVTRLGVLQRFLVAFAFTAQFRRAQRGLHRRDHTREFLFLHIILCPFLEQRYGEIEIDFAGDDDERRVRPYFPGQCQRRRGTEARHCMVGGDRVPILAFQRGTHVGRRIHDLAGYVVATAAQCQSQQFGIIRRIVNDQQAQGVGHELAPRPNRRFKSAGSRRCVQGKDRSALDVAASERASY